MTFEEELAREHELDARARAAALELFRVCRELGWGCGEPVKDAYSRIADAARSEGYEEELGPRTPAARRKLSRQAARTVWDRDGWECRRCGSHRNLTVDHIHPIALGGTDDLDNLQTLCGSCNSSKGARV